MLANVLSSLLLVFLCACTTVTSPQEKTRMLNEATARKYVAAWATKVHADLKDLKNGQGGDFYGRLGSLGFDYLAKDNMLVVRAYIFPYSASFTAKQDLLPWLNDLARADSDSVSHGMFETCIPRWEPDREPSLFLRIDLTDGMQSESGVIARLVKFREDSMVWSNTKLGEALDGLVRKRRQEKQQQQK